MKSASIHIMALVFQMAIFLPGEASEPSEGVMAENEARLQILGCENYEKKFLDIEVDFRPEAGSRSVLECILASSTWCLLPFVGKFSVLIYTDSELMQIIEVRHYLVITETRTVSPILYDISFPTQNTMKLQTPTILGFRIPVQELKSLTRGKKNGTALELALRFHEKRYPTDGKQFESRILLSGRFKIGEEAQGKWILLTKKLSLPVRVEKNEHTRQP